MRDDWSDPNVLFAPSPHEFRIYGDDMAQTWAVVDEVDYAFLVRWRWSWKVSRGGGKRYLRRVVDDYIKGSAYYSTEPGADGAKQVQVKQRKSQTLFLHTAVILRKGDPPPSQHHHIVDHLDGDEANCRRGNLRWATHTMNNNNMFGAEAKQLDMLSVLPACQG